MTDQLFAEATQRAMSRTMPIMELLQTVDQLSRAGADEQLISLYKSWAHAHLDHPLVHAAYFNLGVFYSQKDRLGEAMEALGLALRFKPDFYPAFINLGTVLERMGFKEQAIQQWRAMTERLSALTAENAQYRVTGFKQIARVQEASSQDPAAEESLQQTLLVDGSQREAIQHWVALRQRQCKWPVITPFGEMTAQKLIQGMSPLSMAAYTDDPVLQLANAHAYHKYDVGRLSGMMVAGDWMPPDSGDRGRRLRIGYISSDLREHAVGLLMSEVFELHNRDRVEVFAYYCGIPGMDATKQRTQKAVEHWVDISGMNDAQAAKQILNDGIDILVDVNGYTKDAKTRIFAMRPAPIQVNWLGYPGTMGSPHHHYIIADPVLVPAGDERYYSEMVARLPCYQPNDRKRVIAEHRPTRQEAGLPEEAMVFCCFNGQQKFTRFTYDRWMQILHLVPNSVLWVLSSNPPTDKILIEEAAKRGIAPERIILGPRRANPEHLARYPLADLFLDTNPYGAHTTASDALWMGVPVLTILGRSFASRVCASLVHSAGMDELICATPDEYVAKAVLLGNNRELLQSVKQKLIAQRDQCVLFNMNLLVERLEDLYDAMWSRYATGLSPSPNLLNLEIYHQIGASFAHEEKEQLCNPRYEAEYLQALAYRHLEAPLPYDGRLWKGGGEQASF